MLRVLDILKHQSWFSNYFFIKV